MEDLEKILSSLPKHELSKKADFKIKFKIHAFILSRNLQKLAQAFFHPHSLVAKVSLVALAIFVLLGGTAVYAVNNDHITPGNSLYPLKKTIENVEQKISLTKSAKVDTLNKLSERRLKEALNMAEQDNNKEDLKQATEINNNIEQSINEAVTNFDSAVETSQKIINTENSKKTKENLKKKKESMVQYLDNLGGIAKDKNNEAMIKKVDEAKKAIDKYDEVLDDDKNETRIKPVEKNKDREIIKENKNRRTDRIGEDLEDKTRDSFDEKSNSSEDDVD